MPVDSEKYNIVPFHNGYRVRADNGTYYSNKPLTYKRARQQQKALYAKQERGEIFHGAGYSVLEHNGKQHIILEGEGFIGDMFAKVKNTLNKAFKATTKGLKFIAQGPRDDYPPSSRQILQTYGNGLITGILLRREPINSLINKALDYITKNRYSSAKQELAYDNLFHLSLIANVVLPDGTNKAILIEKNEVINITDKFSSNPNIQYFTVNVPVPISLYEFLQRAREIGGRDFFMYDAFNNNCQMFINLLLSANGLSTPEARHFILQDVKTLLQRLPGYTQPVARLITDIAGIANRAFFGDGKQIEMPRGRPPVVIPASEFFAEHKHIADLFDGIVKKLADEAKSQKMEATNRARAMLKQKVIKQKKLKGKSNGVMKGDGFWDDFRTGFNQVLPGIIPKPPPSQKVIDMMGKFKNLIAEVGEDEARRRMGFLPRGSGLTGGMDQPPEAPEHIRRRGYHRQARFGNRMAMIPVAITEQRPMSAVVRPEMFAPEALERIGFTPQMIRLMGHGYKNPKDDRLRGGFLGALLGAVSRFLPKIIPAVAKVATKAAPVVAKVAAKAAPVVKTVVKEAAKQALPTLASMAMPAPPTPSVDINVRSIPPEETPTEPTKGAGRKRKMKGGVNVREVVDRVKELAGRYGLPASMIASGVASAGAMANMMYPSNVFGIPETITISMAMGIAGSLLPYILREIYRDLTEKKITPTQARRDLMEIDELQRLLREVGLIAYQERSELPEDDPRKISEQTYIDEARKLMLLTQGLDALKANREQRGLPSLVNLNTVPEKLTVMEKIGDEYVPRSVSARRLIGETITERNRLAEQQEEQEAEQDGLRQRRGRGKYSGGQLTPEQQQQLQRILRIMSSLGLSATGFATPWIAGLDSASSSGAGWASIFLGAAGAIIPWLISRTRTSLAERDITPTQATGILREIGELQDGLTQLGEDLDEEMFDGRVQDEQSWRRMYNSAMKSTEALSDLAKEKASADVREQLRTAEPSQRKAILRKVKVSREDIPKTITRRLPQDDIDTVIPLRSMVSFPWERIQMEAEDKPKNTVVAPEVVVAPTRTARVAAAQARPILTVVRNPIRNIVPPVSETAPTEVIIDNPMMNLPGATGQGKPKKWIQTVVRDMKKGAFTKQAKRARMTPVEFAETVLANPGKYTLTTRRRAQFMKNVGKRLFGSGDEDDDEELARIFAESMNMSPAVPKDTGRQSVMKNPIVKPVAKPIAKPVASKSKPKTPSPPKTRGNKRKLSPIPEEPETTGRGKRGSKKKV